MSFELKWQKQVPDISARAMMYAHRATGAEVLIIETEDENKVFGVGFPTLPEDSSGIAHILEHSVLCGSEKYPLREPFVELIKGSLQTFLNAMTYPDKTIYPVASQNEQDLYNLADVYIDAVFHPLLGENVFKQEGWRLEPQDLQDPNSALVYKGVVYNEMKGDIASPDGILFDEVLHAIFPDTEYRHNSGGEPSEIVKLDYAKFVEFHQYHYHPSNAKFYFYGNGDTEKHLQFLDQRLSGYQAGRVTAMPAVQPVFAEPRQLDKYYPAGADQHKAYVTLNWALQEATSPVDLLGLEILYYMLLESDAAPLGNALLESNLGEDLTGIGLERDMRVPLWSIGLKGVKPEDTVDVTNLIMSELRKYAAGGLDAELILAAVNRMEFEYREQRSGTMPKGLVLWESMLQNWMYGQDPLREVSFVDNFKQIRSWMHDGYFADLVSKYLINNPHRLQLRLLPDPELAAHQAKAEIESLVVRRAQLTATELSDLGRAAQAFTAWQTAPEPPEVTATLPTLHVSDLPKEIRRIDERITTQGPLTVYRHELPTNGIVYLGLGFEMTNLPQELLAYMSIFAEALLRMGTSRQTYAQIANRIDLRTGGVAAQSHITPVMNQFDQEHLYLFLNGKALAADVGELIAIYRDLIYDVKLDQPEKLRQILLEERAGLESSIVRSGTSYAFNRVGAHFRQACVTQEELSGIAYMQAVRQMITDLDSNWPLVLAKLRQVQAILQRSRQAIVVTADSASQPEVDAAIRTINELFPTPGIQLPKIKYKLITEDEGFVIPANVNFVGIGYDLHATGYQLDGAIYLVQNLLATDFAWNRIRMQGGAYGAYADYQIRSGFLQFSSYRDPHVWETLQAYKDAVPFLTTKQFTAADIEKGIIGSIGRMDKYLDPDQKGWLAFDRALSNMTDSVRQTLRDQLLAADTPQLAAFGHHLSQAVSSRAHMAILGEEGKLLEAQAKLNGQLQISKLL